MRKVREWQSYFNDKNPAQKCGVFAYVPYQFNFRPGSLDKALLLC